ncbi:MAG: stage V sporulation protein AC [Eubacteriaceae bacterium]
MKKISNQEYKQLYEQKKPKEKIFLNCVKAFVVGGIICMIGQGINDILVKVMDISKENAASYTSIILVFIAALLTGLGVYDEIGKFAGAGSIVPITGFANSVISPAMEFKKEGMIFGTSAKIFTLAGPVIVFGLLSTWICSFIYYLYRVIAL